MLISTFWLWFEDNLAHLRDVLTDPGHPSRDYLVDSLNNHLLAIGTFTWDIEAGSSRRWSLTISPNGDADLLELSREIVAMAPDLADWEFYYAKQPSRPELVLTVWDEEMNQQTVDANPWTYVLLPASGDGYDLLIEAPNAAHVDDETLHTTADHLVTALMGEEAKIIRLRSIDLTDSLSAANQKLARPLVQLCLPEGR